MIKLMRLDLEKVKVLKGVFGILHQKPIENEESNPDKLLDKLLAAPLAFLVHVINVNLEKKELDVTIPSSTESSSSLIYNYWLYSEITWVK